MTGEHADPPRPAGDDEDEQTIDADADLLEHVREVARAAREGLSAPPAPPAIADEPSTPVPPDEPATAAGTGLWSPPPPGGPTNTLLPTAEPGGPSVASAAAPITPVALTPGPEAPAAAALPPPVPPSVPATPAVAAAPAAEAAGPSGGRWQPPPRLRPAELRSTAPLLADGTPTRRHLDWRWAALGIALAAVVSFLIAIAVIGGDDAPEPTPGSTTLPGASTTATTP